MSYHGLAFRSLLSQLGSERFFAEHAGRPNQLLVDLWGMAVEESRNASISFEAAKEIFMEGYDGFPPTAAPWSLLLAESIAGFSGGSDDPHWMLRVAGEAFAAYGVKPRFGR